MGGPEQELLAPALVRSLIRPRHRFAVTGASGWLGRTALGLLADALGSSAFGERVSAFASTAKEIRLRAGLSVEARPLEELASAMTPATYLLHFAYLTRDRAATDVEGYVATNVGITAKVVHALHAGAAGVLVASSGAVYGGGTGRAHDLQRDPYGTLKHLDELAIGQAASRAGSACAIARIFSLGGREMTKPHLYALGDFVLRALAGEPIRIRSAGPVIRSYAADSDVVALGLAALIHPPPSGEVTFDTGGTEIEVGDLALLVRDLVGPPGLVVERSSAGRLDEDRYVGRGAEMEALARLHGLRPASLDDVVLATADGLRAETASVAGRSPSVSIGADGSLPRGLP